MAKCFQFDRVYASPFARTLETASLLIERSKGTAEIVEEDRLREIDFGVLDRLTKLGIQIQFPQEAERKKKLGKYYFRPPGAAEGARQWVESRSKLDWKEFVCRYVDRRMRATIKPKFFDTSCQQR